MTAITLKPDDLYTSCHPGDIPYAVTSDAVACGAVIPGQQRALDAIEFGVGMRRDNYHLYVAGSNGLGKHAVVNRLLKQLAADQETPSDWCYVNNPEGFYAPNAIELPAGMGVQLRQDMSRLIRDLSIAVPAAFESDEYRSRVQQIEDRSEEKKEHTLGELADRALGQGVLLTRTESGYTLSPTNSDQPMEADEFKQLRQVEQDRIEALIDALKQELKAVLLKIPAWAKEAMEKLRELNRSLASSTVDQYFPELLQKYAALPGVTAYLGSVHDDIIANIEDFLPDESADPGIKNRQQPASAELQRFEVNVLVDNSQLQGVPVIYEDNPTYNNLAGRIEHIAEYGTMITNFSLIKPGALHRANGGYLILDADKILNHDFAWELLKRALYAKEIRIETLEHALSLVNTISLEPQTIPLHIKLILVGSHSIYGLLKSHDPEFDELFKVMVDFAGDLIRDAASTQQFAALIADMVKQNDLLVVTRDAAARIIEYASREADDAEKLSLHLGCIKDLLMESDYWARGNKHQQISRRDVQQAIDARLYRCDQLREIMHEEILRNTVLIDTRGECAGQVNALTVIHSGDFSFGQPSRITATAHLGDGKVVDIEREVELGGPIHSKGVLILSSCLAHRYAQKQTLALGATLVFEQNYAEVEGDSASVAEFCALLSALAKLPIRQDLAVTGSMNQFGQVQAIGGVNQKIEGFYDICNTRGLTGAQGVIIPCANIKHLMLRQDVVDAVVQKKFHITAIDEVDEALELLTGLPAGELDKKDNYAQGSINALVVERLDELHKLHKQSSDDEHDE
jgi:lon-related putative ATP-dependent protease